MNTPVEPTKTAETAPAAAPGATPPAPLGASEPESRTVLSLIRELQAGRLAGSALATPDRRRVVEHLALDGYSVAEIAEILKVCERTINRDRGAVRAGNALSPSPQLVGETVGMLLRQAEAGVGRLRRIGRDREVPAAAKVQAEGAAWTITKDVIALLQSLGYLPTAATRIEATLDARLQTEHAPSYDELQKEIERLEAILGPGASSSPEFQLLAGLKDTVSRLAVGQQLKALSLPARDLIDQSEAPAAPSESAHPSSSSPGQEVPAPASQEAP